MREEITSFLIFFLSLTFAGAVAELSAKAFRVKTPFFRAAASGLGYAVLKLGLIS